VEYRRQVDNIFLFGEPRMSSQFGFHYFFRIAVDLHDVFEGVGFVDVVLATQFHHETECGIYVRHFVKGVSLFIYAVHLFFKKDFNFSCPHLGDMKTTPDMKLVFHVQTIFCIPPTSVS
jgi:hypothetical protein